MTIIEFHRHLLQASSSDRLIRTTAKLARQSQATLRAIDQNHQLVWDTWNPGGGDSARTSLASS